MQETYEHGSLAAVNNPVFIDITLMTGVKPFPGRFVGCGGLGIDGFGVGEIGRLLSAGFTLTTEFIFDGGVCISTIISPAVFPGPGFGGDGAIGRCDWTGACLP